MDMIDCISANNEREESCRERKMGWNTAKAAKEVI